MTTVSQSLIHHVDIMDQLKPINREFVAAQIQRGTWDFAIDIARFSLANLEGTSTNDLLMQQALGQFNSNVIQIRDQILDAFRSNAKQFGEDILEGLNRHLAVVHQRLESINSEHAALSPSLKESLACLNGSASALSALIASLKLPTAKGDIGEIGILDNLRSAFLGIPSVSIEPLGGPGDSDALIHFNMNGWEFANVLVENKNRSAWSNSFLTQLERHMSDRRAQFGILVSATLPKGAKSRGYTVTDQGGIIVITSPDLAPSVGLLLYELIRSLDTLSTKGETLNALLRSRELVECLTSNLSLVEPLRAIIKIMDKAHAEVSTNVNNITEAIQRNNAKLIKSLPQSEVKSS
jgi:hypothetical protein